MHSYAWLISKSAVSQSAMEGQPEPLLLGLEICFYLKFSPFSEAGYISSFSLTTGPPIPP